MTEHYFCKVCGNRNATLEVWHEQGGHGSMDKWAQVRCPCGTSGPKVMEWDNPFEQDAADKWVALHGGERP